MYYSNRLRLGVVLAKASVFRCSIGMRFCSSTDKQLRYRRASISYLKLGHREATMAVGNELEGVVVVVVECTGLEYDVWIYIRAREREGGFIALVVVRVAGVDTHHRCSV